MIGLLEVVFHRKDRRLSRGLIPSLFSKRLLKKGCRGHLAHVIDTRAGGIRLKDVPMVRDFPDMFSNKLLGLPSERQIEFSIDLVQNTVPISLPSYRMAPIELRELKV